VGWGGRDWFDLAGDGNRWPAGACECGNEPSGSQKCGVFLEKLRTVSFSGRMVLHAVVCKQGSRECS